MKILYNIHFIIKHRVFRIVMTSFLLSLLIIDTGIQASTEKAIPNCPCVNPEKLESKLLGPIPKYSPDEVVRIQVEALANNDEPYENAGIEVAFLFASPDNKKVTGPLERFIRTVRNPIYRPILNHKIAHYGELRIIDDQAIQPVILTTAEDKRVGYVFILSKQRGEPCECWMTDSVIRFKVSEA